MLPDQVSNPGPLTYESGALPIALRGPACGDAEGRIQYTMCTALADTYLMCLSIGTPKAINFPLSQMKN